MDGRMDVKWREECLPFRGVYAIAMLLSPPGTLARYVRSPCWGVWRMVRLGMWCRRKIELGVDCGGVEFRRRVGRGWGTGRGGLGGRFYQLGR